MESAYVLAGIIVVVLIIIFALVWWYRGRRAAPKIAEKPADLTASLDTDQQETTESLIADWRASKSDQSAAPLPASETASLDAGQEAGGAPLAGLETNLAGEAVGTESVPPSPLPDSTAPGDAGASTEPSFAPRTVLAHTAAPLGQSDVLRDPLHTVILDMLKGEGPLTREDLKRLEVFRLEKISEVASTLELSPELKINDEAMTRLAEIQLYASSLRLKARWVAETPLPPPGKGQESLSARQLKLKMAEDIMALPSPDRADVIGFLLTEMLSMNGNSALKRAVIDTLEHLGSSALVNVLLVSLDDSDPFIQSYALEAADRLLGTSDGEPVTPVQAAGFRAR